MHKTKPALESTTTLEPPPPSHIMYVCELIKNPLYPRHRFQQSTDITGRAGDRVKLHDRSCNKCFEIDRFIPNSSYRNPCGLHSHIIRLRISIAWKGEKNKRLYIILRSHNCTLTASLLGIMVK